jgi:phenylacetate-coenzyme A ligase PaaK-like adenylate-forming protein
MKLLDNIRNRMFWVTDFLKGADTHRHYKEIKFVLENYNSSASLDIRKKHLNKLLQHASTTAPFYKKYKKASSLSNFPVITKPMIQNNYDAFRSELYINKKCYKLATSGSTGTPFAVFHQKNKRIRSIADTIYFAERAGYKLGTKLVFIKIWVPHNKKNRLLAWMQNVQMIDVRALKENLQLFLSKLKNSKTEMAIVSHASALETISDYLDEIKTPTINCNINSIIAISEQLNTYTKKNIEKHFGKTVVSRYSNVENGIIAQQKVNSGLEFEINWASYFVEVLKFNTDEPIDEGEVGRIVVTDLFNYCMPIIRYDTGDIGSIIKNDKGVPVFNCIEGRKLDMVFSTEGKWVPSLLIGGLMKKYSNVMQFQFFQEEEKKYMFKLNVNGNFINENKLVNEFTNLFGEDSQIKVKYIDEIPLLSSGKRRYVINNYNKN